MGSSGLRRACAHSLQAGKPHCVHACSSPAPAPLRAAVRLDCFWMCHSAPIPWQVCYTRENCRQRQAHSLPPLSSGVGMSYHVTWGKRSVIPTTGQNDRTYRVHPPRNHHAETIIHSSPPPHRPTTERQIAERVHEGEGPSQTSHKQDISM